MFLNFMSTPFFNNGGQGWNRTTLSYSKHDIFARFILFLSAIRFSARHTLRLPARFLVQRMGIEPIFSELKVRRPPHLVRRCIAYKIQGRNYFGMPTSKGIVFYVQESNLPCQLQASPI